MTIKKFLIIISIAFFTLAKDKYNISGTNNTFHIKHKKAITASITNVGNCCNCKNSVEYKISKITKFNENENSKIILVKKNYIVFLEENLIKIKKLDEKRRNYFLDLIFEKKIEIYENEKDLFFFDMKILKRHFFFFISKNKLLVYEFDLDSENIFFKIILKKNLNFEKKEIISF